MKIICLFSLEPSALSKRYDELKNKLREELKEELRAISGDTAAPTAGKAPRKTLPNTTDNTKTRAVDKTDYFELVYECIHTRNNFLNVISLNSRNPVEPDIDLVILQALLTGKKLKFEEKTNKKTDFLHLATSGNDSNKTDIQQKRQLKREQLHLALEWNRVDIAKNYIMRDEHDWEVRVFNDI